MNNVGYMTLLASLAPMIAMVIGLGVAGADARLIENPWGGIVAGGVTMIVLTLLVSVAFAARLFNEGMADLQGSINQSFENSVGEQSN